ncbi:MAG: TonB-dependent receptor, partial [Burkholderiales bacterium]
EELRGFGATAGNVLINGRRPSSKDSISDQLQRVSANDVLRIELIGGSASGLTDVRGHAELANVVLRSSNALRESTTYEGILSWAGERLSQSAIATRAWETEALSGSLSVQLTNRAERETTDITETNAAGVVLSRAEQFSQSQISDVTLKGDLNWKIGPSDMINLTGKLIPRNFTIQTGIDTRSATGVPVAYASSDYIEKDILHAEFGADYEHTVSPDSSFKLVAVNRLINWRPKDDFKELMIGGGADTTMINTDLRYGEHVIRGTWRQKAFGDHALEMGVEAALNYRDATLGIVFSENGGAFVPIDLPVATTKVEELRYEAFISDTWRVTPRLTLELGFTQEMSTISQSGDAEQERDFSYPKPRAIATWTPTAQDQLRLSFERRVAQLEFSDFASNISLVENVVTVGQCNAAPVNDPACVFTAAGNIGEGKSYGIEFDATLPLDILGISGGLLKGSVGWQDSKVTDPIDLQTRRLGEQTAWTYYLEFRQDIPEWDIAWGWDYYSEGPQTEFRLDEIRRDDLGEGDFDLFVETTALLDGVLVRLSADNIFDYPIDTSRRMFSPNRLPGGVFAGAEHRVERQGPTISLSISGAF